MSDDRAVGFRDFVERHERDLRAYVARRFSESGLRDDIVQETLVVAWKRFDELEQRVDPSLHRAWLCRVARNVGRDQRRGEARRRDRHDRLSADRSSPPAWSEPTEAVEVDDVVRRFLDRLAPDDRELLTAAAWDDFSGRELAELLGCKEATARKRLSRLVARLRDELPPAAGGLS